MIINATMPQLTHPKTLTPHIVQTNVIIQAANRAIPKCLGIIPSTDTAVDASSTLSLVDKSKTINFLLNKKCAARRNSLVIIIR